MLAAALRFVEQELPACSSPTELLNALDRCVSAPAKIDARYIPINACGAWLTPRQRFRVASYAMNGNVFYPDNVPGKFRDELFATLPLKGVSVMAQMAWISNGPFTFTECMRKMRPQGDERWIFDLLSRFTIRDGFYCPVNRWMVIYWSQRVLSNLSNRHRSLLYFMAVVAAGRLAEMVPTTKTTKEPRLTPRELAVLSGLAQGQRAEEIAVKLHLAPGTVETYIERAKKKLDAKTRTHAVAKAMRRMLMK